MKKSTILCLSLVFASQLQGMHKDITSIACEAESSSMPLCIPELTLLTLQSLFNRLSGEEAVKDFNASKAGTNVDELFLKFFTNEVLVTDSVKLIPSNEFDLSFLQSLHTLLHKESFTIFEINLCLPDALVGFLNKCILSYGESKVEEAIRLLCMIKIHFSIRFAPDAI